jgi:23S rRNA pseudouridine2605 synthase
VEKTYLVKVAGQPSEAELDLLRGGVAIERDKPGSPQVRTAPARVRQVRQGDNPWYEVVLIEGRNRELRKMFEEIGHFVEKIRRVGYGPLVLDQEPGNLRELHPEELEALRKAAEGKLRTPKAKEVRRRNAADAQLPTVAPRITGPRATRTFPAKSFDARPAVPNDYRPKRFFAEGSEADRPARPSGKNFGPTRPSGRASARPAWRKDARPTRPPARFAAGSANQDRPATGKPYGGKPTTGRAYRAKPGTRVGYRDKPYGDKPAFDKPAWSKPASPDRPFSKHPPASGRGERAFEGPGLRKPSRRDIEAARQQEGPSRPIAPRAYSGRPKPARFSADRPASNRPGSNRNFRGEGGLTRPFTTGSVKPRAGGARPGGKPGVPTDRSSSVGRKPGWKPKPSYGGPGKPASSGRSKPRPGSSAKSGYKGKPSGPRRSGSPGGKRRG